MTRIGLVALIAVLAVGLLPSVVEAGKVKVWTHDGPAGFEKAQLKGTLLTSEGQVRLSRRLDPLANLDATHVWDLVEDQAGNLYAATGEEGKVYKITPDGKVSVLFTADDAQVLSLAIASDGTLLAGTGPGGQVVKIDPTTGKNRALFQQPNTYVWSLAVDGKDGSVYAATGPRGRVYKIAADGTSSVFYQTRQDHVLCLARSGDGNLYAGTDGHGLVYRIDPHGKGFVLFQAPQSEVRRLIVTDDAVYACTSAPGKKRTGSAALSGSSGGLAQAASTAGEPATKVGGATPRATKPDEKTADSKSSKTDNKEPAKGESAPAPSTPGSGDNSVYRLGKDGSVREVFREKALLLSLARQGGRFLVGAGMGAQLFAFDEASKERTEVVRLDHGQVLSLLPRRDGSLVVGTGDPGQLYVLREEVAGRGTLLSDVLDAKLLSRWGAMTWRAEMPKGSSVKVEVRSGNLSEPDSTWSDWIEVIGDGNGKITAPSARFLQYRATLVAAADGRTSPSFGTVNVRYQPMNLAPEVTKLDTPDLNAVNLDNPKKVKLKWTATDPNEDELTFTVLVRKQGWSAWVEVEEELTKTELEWDTTTTPAGIYQVKIVASDRKDNSESAALTAEKVSPTFVVCNVPPTVTLTVAGLAGDRVGLEATATSPLARIVEASFAINGKNWTPIFPADGLFDGPKETFTFKTASLKPGTYVAMVKTKDAAGNVGTADAVFTVAAK